MASARKGIAVDFRTDADDGPHEVEQWSEDRRVRAEVIAALVSGADSLTRFSLCGARILCDLDLAGARLQTSLLFERCVFDGDLKLAEAATRSVRLRGCHLSHLDASRITLDGELEVTGCRLDTISLYGARTGDVEISGSTFTSPSVGVQADLAASTAPATVTTPSSMDSCGCLVLASRATWSWTAPRSAAGSSPGTSTSTTACTAASGSPPTVPGAPSTATSTCGAPGSNASCASTPPRLTVLDLRQARVDSLWDDPAHWPRETRLDGLRYEDLAPRLPAPARLDWLSRDRNGWILATAVVAGITRQLVRP